MAADSERLAAYTMRELPDDDRPRERLLAHGAEVLSDAELVAILLRSGPPGENVVEMARRLINTSGGLAGLARADLKALQRARGLGPAKAAELAAAIELGRRVQQVDPDSRPMLGTPEAVASLLGPRLTGKTKEHFFAICVDTRSRLLGSLTPLLRGTVNAVSIRPAEAFREAIVIEAPSVVLAHNHPSGDPRPSAPDLTVTKLLYAAGQLLDIEVLDHVIIGQNSYFSFQKEGISFGRDAYP